MADVNNSNYTHRLRFKCFVTLLLFSAVPLLIYWGFSVYHISSGRQFVETQHSKNAKATLKSLKLIEEKVVETNIRKYEDKFAQIIEMRAHEIAKRVSEFLYNRDRDIRFLADQKPDVELYQSFYRRSYRDVAVHNSQINEPGEPQKKRVHYKNSDNSQAWSNHPAEPLTTMRKPVYRELTYINLQGVEQIKIQQQGISVNLVDVSDKANTFCKAETYFSFLDTLQKGEIYVSRVIGEYQRGWLDKDKNGKFIVKKGSAYAQKENPQGKPFQGIIRWCMPVYQDSEKQGYLTLALDHTHLMAFTDHCTTVPEMIIGLNAADSGNYAAMWDFEGKCISHPRDFFISGYDLQTGMQVPGWLSEHMYTEFKQTGVSLNRFISQLPPFRNFSITKSGSTSQMAAGEIPLDCKVLDFAPQCEGWYRGTMHGGSGSFKITDNTMPQLTSYAAIPYDTGLYGNSARGFGYVTFGVTLRMVHEEVKPTNASIEKMIVEEAVDLDQQAKKTAALMAAHTRQKYGAMGFGCLVLFLMAVALSFKAGSQLARPVEALTREVSDITRNEGKQSVAIDAYDETRIVADAFNGLLNLVSESENTKNTLVEDLEKTNKRLNLEIDERSETEKALRNNEQRYRNIFENIMDIYYRTDNNGIITLVSPSAVDFFGYASVDDIIGKSVAETFYQDPDDRQLLFEAMENSGSVTNFIVYLRKKDNTRVTLETCSQYIYDENMHKKGIEGVLHDVTEVKKVEEELKKSNRVLNETIETLTNTQKQLVEAEKMASLGNLVAGVAHEINTPVGICVTAASFLQEKTSELMAVMQSGYYVTEDLEEFCNSADDAASMILSNLNRASELISSFKKVAVDQSTEDKRVFNVKRYVNEVLISIRPKYKKYHHTFTINCPDDLKVYSYPGAFFQIISNLIMNSLIHGFPDESGGNIGFDISYDGTDFIFIYSDNGMGMDEETLKKLFEPFFTTRRGMGGTGLGMNIVYNLVTMKLNGRITCDSMLGEGASFFVAISENDAFKVVNQDV